MAAAFSSFTDPQVMKYDVFLSFRGEDTRNNFTSHLHVALCRKRIKTFIDNQLIRGDGISPSLVNAIEASKISVIIFSKGYASSRWCLEELVKILECKNRYGQIVIPIFYHVDPSHVRNQAGAFKDAFAELKERFEEKLETLQRWRIALKEAACLSGWTVDGHKTEYVLIEETVTDILKRLNRLSPSFNKDLVGVDFAIKRIESLLCIGSDGICIVGIWGIGGIGKTTIGHAIFDKNFNNFEGSYFVENVREESENNRLSHLRNELLSTILEDGHTNIGLTFTKERLGRMKILIVFDDVTCLEQIKKLIGDLSCLGSGSRVIITTRDKQVLKNCGVDDANIYKVEGLCDYDAFQLFGQYAFRQNYPAESYIELSNRVVRYAGGLPLALKVLGSSLFSKEKEVWESAINKLEKGPPLDIQKVLKVSYEGLDKEERDIFLDIACFFKWEDVNSVETILNACNFSTNYGISVLVDKCLITISFDNRITMHDLLQEMGREIVREESKNHLGKYSRLWHHKDIYDVLRKNVGTEAVQGIQLDMSKTKEMNLNPDAFARMHNLRFFDFCCPDARLELNDSPPYCSCDGENTNKVYAFDGFELDSTDLIYFRWHGYPMKSLPSKFHPDNLVALIMPHSNIEELWTGVQEFDNLKTINLRYCKQLTKIPDLSLAPNLENLILEGCTSLIEIPSSIHCLNKLIVLNLRDCKNLRSLPTFPSSTKFLYLDGTAIREFPLVEHQTSLIELCLKNCSRLENLPGNCSKLKSLKSLTLIGCSNLERLPNDFGDLEALEKLEVERTAIRELPLSITCSRKLVHLSFCKSQVRVHVLLPSFSGLSSLTYLNLSSSHIKKLPNSLGRLYSLKKLYLCKNNFESIPASIKGLSNLEFLSLRGCKNLQSLPKLPRGLDIDAYECISLTKLSHLSNLFRFNLANCFKLDGNVLTDKVKDGPLRFFALIGDKVNTKKFIGAVDSCICFPGNEIPQWFSFQTIGSSMTIELPPNWQNKNFLGFATCAIVNFSDCVASKDFCVRCSCKTKSKYGAEIEDGYSFLSAWTPDIIDEPLAIHQDHVFLGFDLSMHKPRSWWTAEYNEYVNLSGSNCAYIKFHGFRQKWTSEVIKKCGIYLVYANDCGEPMEGSSIEEEIVEEEKCGIHLGYANDCGEPMEGTSVVEEIVEEEPQIKRLKCFFSGESSVKNFSCNSKFSRNSS